MSDVFTFWSEPKLNYPPYLKKSEGSFDETCSLSSETSGATTNSDATDPYTTTSYGFDPYTDPDQSPQSSPRGTPPVTRRTSICEKFHCRKGHDLVLIPVSHNREAICGSCNSRIKLRPQHLLTYHCNDCNLDACEACINEDMKSLLIDERNHELVEKKFTDCCGSGMYKGQLCYESGNRQGYGKMTWVEDGLSNVYEGSWNNNKREGHGKITYSDGGSYEGLWKNDRKSGYGRRSFSNGFKYHGNFTNDLKNGKGIFKGQTGRWCMAYWEFDEMVGPGKFAPKVRPSPSVWDP